MLALAVLSPPIVAQESGWDDDDVLYAGGDTQLLNEEIRESLFDAASMRSNMDRIGLPATCALVKEIAAAQTEEGAAVFRKALISKMRAIIPAERLSGPVFGYFVSLPDYKNKIAKALESDSSARVTATRESALARFEERVTAIPDTHEPWWDIFSDWDLSSNRAVAAACAQYGLEHPELGKRGFDLFYKRKEPK